MAVASRSTVATYTMTSPSSTMASRPPLFIRLSLPGGLEEALESLAREVLRQQPKDIHQFAASHFEHLLRKRNKGEQHPTRWLQLCQSCTGLIFFFSEQGFAPDHDLEFFTATPAAAVSAASAATAMDKEEQKEAGESSQHDGTKLESISG